MHAKRMTWHAIEVVSRLARRQGATNLQNARRDGDAPARKVKRQKNDMADRMCAGMRPLAQISTKMTEVLVESAAT